MSRFAFNPEMNAGNIAPSGGEAAATTGIDLHRATVFNPSIESHVAAAVPGAEQGIMSAVQAASQPISPLIQMIMRMPGQIGLFSSMFEALGNFLLGHADVLTSAFDPSILTNFHNALTSLPTGEHMGFSLSLLPGDGGSFLNGLTHLGSSTGGADFLNVAKNTAQGFNTHDILKDSIAFRDSLKVSGGLDLNKPQFEMGRMSGQVDGLSKGDALSGPAMRETGSATHLAGANRLFGDRPVALTSHSPMANPTTSVASAQNVPVSNAVTNSMNVSGSGLQAETASMDMSQAVSGSNISQVGDAAASTTGSIGPSGAVGDSLGANKFIAMDKGASGYQPEAHAAAGGYDANYLQHQAPSADSHNLGGMKAQALSLDGMSHAAKSHMANAAGHAGGAASPTHVSTSAHTAPTHSASAAGNSLSHAKPEHIAHKSVMDHIGHQSNGVHHNFGSGHDSIAHVNKAAEAPAASAEAQTGAEGSQVTDGTQIAQATDATQPPVAGDAAAGTAPAPTTYTIRAGDNLWNIAKDHLGSGTKWSELYKMNADVLGSNPAMIHPGTNITLPGDPNSIASAGAEHGTYIVKAGDNLWNIEKGLTGDGSKWGEIYNLNKDVIGSNPSLITPGTELHLPGASGETAGTLAQAPTAAASQQLASVPQAVAPSAPTPAIGSDLHMEGGSPIAADGTVAQAPIQSYPAELQAQAAPGAQGTEMPLLPEQAAMTPAAPPVQTSHLGGPGAAAAAELGPQPTPAELHTIVKNNDIVSSKLSADLSSFLRKNK